MQQQITVTLLQTAMLQCLRSIWMKSVWRLIQQNTYVWQHLLPLLCHAPLYQISIDVLWYMQQAIS